MRNILVVAFLTALLVGAASCGQDGVQKPDATAYDRVILGSTAVADVLRVPSVDAQAKYVPNSTITNDLTAIYWRQAPQVRRVDVVYQSPRTGDYFGYFLFERWTDNTLRPSASVCMWDGHTSVGREIDVSCSDGRSGQRQTDWAWEIDGADVVESQGSRNIGGEASDCYAANHIRLAWDFTFCVSHDLQVLTYISNTPLGELTAARIESPLPSGWPQSMIESGDRTNVTPTDIGLPDDIAQLLSVRP